MRRISPLFYLLFLGLFFRLVFLFPQYSGDLKNHLVWGNAFLANPLGLYSRHFPGFNDINYPPLAIILFGLSNLFLSCLNNFLGFLNSHFSFFPSSLIPLFAHENMHFGFLKLPSIIADLGIGYILYQFSFLWKIKNPYLLSSLYLFNPATIYLSSVWGQIEPVTNFFLLLSLCLTLPNKSTKSPTLSLISFTLAALTKQTALWFLPFYLFLWLRHTTYTKLIVPLFYSFLFFFICYLPFGLFPLPALQSYLATLSGSSTVVSDAAWNFWYFLFPGGAEDSLRFGFITIRQISVTILIIFLVLFLAKLFKNYSDRYFLKYLFFWSLAVFFFQTRVHERHLAPSLIFSLLIFAENPFWWFTYLSLSLFHFLNLFLTLKLPFV